MAKTSNIDERFSAAELAAIAKVKGKNGELPVGDYPVNVTLHVQAIVRKGEDYERTPTASVPVKKALALFVRYSGVTREAAIKALEKAMTDALDSGIEANFGDLDVAEAKVIKALGNLPKVKVAGTTTVHDLVVERVEPVKIIEADILTAKTA